MHQLRHVSPEARKQRASTNPVFVQRASSDRRNRGRISGLRQAEEFSERLKKIRRSGYLCVGALVFLSLICLNFSIHHIDVIAFFSAGAVVLLIQLAMIGTDYFHEEKRAAQAYWQYLDTFSFQVLSDLRHTSRLSDWSRYEIDKYLSVVHV